MPNNEADNLCRWQPDQRGHYEVWYLTCNHLDSKTGYWIRYTMEAPEQGAAYAQQWFAFFDATDPSANFAINKKYAIDQFQTTESPFSVDLHRNTLTHGSARGCLAGNGHEARWDLTWQPTGITHRQLPNLMYRRGGLGDTTVLTPSINVPLHGEIEVDGRTHQLSGDPGGQTHLWGSKHAHSWAWGHCNAFEGNTSAALETLTVRLKKAGRVLPPMTMMSLYVDGEAFTWNTFGRIALARGDYNTASYRFRASSMRYRIVGSYRCRRQDMVTAHYVDPDGDSAWCANTEVADLDVTVYQRAGLSSWRMHKQLHAPQTGHFEVGGRTRDESIEANHTEIE